MIKKICYILHIFISYIIDALNKSEKVIKNIMRSRSGYICNMKLTVKAILFLFLTIINASSAERMRIAILDFNGKGVTSSVTTAVSDIIKSDIVNTGLFKVI